jgi:serine/threonine-protein kinase
MGVVYRAEDTRLERPVALKFLPHGGFIEQSKSRFLNEARAAAKARHPNICPIYDIEEADGELFIAMACIEGETLAQKVARGPLQPLQAAEVAVQAASGLACAHRLGIVHRDIKSSNIMLDAAGQVFIMDFGLALSFDATRLTSAGASVGTPAYMSPEQAQGRDVDARTDIWSLGIVLYEMLTGTAPFRREHRDALIYAIVHDPAPALPESIPAPLREVVAKALVKDPAGRWQSAAEVETRLRRYLGTSSTGSHWDALATETLITSAPAGRRRRRWWLAAVAAAFLIGGAAGVWTLADWRRPAESAVTHPAGRQIAILPFQTAAPGQAVSSVADGMIEILTAALSNFEHSERGLTAIPTSEIRRRGITTPEAARRFFGATLAVTGSAQAAGDKVEFTANLVDTAAGRQIGTRTFLYDPGDPLASRDRAVSAVLQMLNMEVPTAARAAIAAGDTAQPTAYSAYLEGRGLLARYDVPGNVDKAIGSFTAAARQDPKYALAYAGLGEAYWRKARTTGDREAGALAAQNAEYAVRLDGSLPIVHSVLGSVYRDAGRQQDAINEFLRAMELAPANAEAPRQLAEIYSALGRFDEAEKLYVSAAASRPTDWYGHLLLGLFYYGRERYAEAEAELNQAKALTPDNDLVRIDLGAVYRMHGRYREAVEEYQQALRIRSSASTYAGLGGAYYYEHRFAEAVAAVEAAIDLDSSDYRYWGNLGIYYGWVPGSEAKAAPALRRAIELAEKFAATQKFDYSVRANLAEYRARLGDATGALAEIDRIPQGARTPLTTRLAIVYELTGHRDRAIEAIRTNLKSPASLNQIKDDPDLGSLWREAKLR